MSRLSRICYPGAVYHVLQKGNNKQNIFLDDNDRWHFLKLFLEAKRQFHYLLYCYVLMDNHFHMTIETPNSIPISRIMHSATGRYAFYFNKKYNREGHLFKERFKTIIVEKESYLLELSRYVHLNPVKAGFVDLPEQYKWSSYNIYLGMKNDILVDISMILSYFNNPPDGGDNSNEYKKFVESKIPEIRKEKDWLESNLIRKNFLGSKDFVKKFQKK